MIVHLILLLLMSFCLQIESANQNSVLERYEERLNSAMSKKNGVSRTVKRYKCVEEYVTYDQNGHTITSYQGPKFSTTMEPPSYRTSGEKEIRRKPARKVTIALNRNSEESDSTSMAMTSTMKTETTTSQKPFDEMNDEEADRIIEEMYLKKKESRVTESPEDVIRQKMPHETIESPRPLPLPQMAESLSKQHSYSTSSSNSKAPRYNPMKQNMILPQDSDEDYPLYHRESRKRTYEDSSDYDDYDNIPLYRPLRREYRMRRRRPILFSEDYSDKPDFDQRIGNSPRHQTTRDLNPLRAVKRLRHQIPFNQQYRPAGTLATINLPVSSSTNMLHRPMPLPLAPQPLSGPSAQGAPLPLPGVVPGYMPIQPSLTTIYNPHQPSSPPPHLLQPIQQQQSVSSGNQEVLKMKPILQANPQEMQQATPESCSKITKLAKSFSIKDVSKWARSNCAFLQMYAPTASCELIYHFIDSCKTKKFL